MLDKDMDSISNGIDKLLDYHKKILEDLKKEDIDKVNVVQFKDAFHGLEICLNRDLRLFKRNVDNYNDKLEEYDNEEYAYNYKDICEDILSFFLADIGYYNDMIKLMEESSLNHEGYLNVYYAYCEDFKDIITKIKI